MAEWADPILSRVNVRREATRGISVFAHFYVWADELIADALSVEASECYTYQDCRLRHEPNLEADEPSIGLKSLYDSRHCRKERHGGSGESVGQGTITAK